jgi:hypothetical protein
LCSPNRPYLLQGPHSLLFNGYRGFYSGAKRPELEVYLSTPSSAEVKNEWNCTSTPHVMITMVMMMMMIIIIIIIIIM